MVEATVPGQAEDNATILTAALEEFGWLDAGPFGAVYDMGHVATDMLTTPFVSIEGKGSQTFNALPADFTNTVEVDQYGPTAAMFSFEGSVTGQGTSDVAVTYGGEAHICGVNIIGPGTGTGTQRITIPVCARFLDRFYAEGLDISNFQRGSLIGVVAVRYGGRINGNHLHDCVYDASLGSPDFAEMFGISVDDNKPSSDNPVTPDRLVAWSDGFEIAGNVIDSLTAINPTGTMQTDGINLQMLTRNHRIHDNRISNVGDGIDGGPWYSIIRGNLISNTTLGMKLLYGMNGTLVDGNLLNDIAQIGMLIAGSGFTGMPTQDNFIIGNKIERVNMAGVVVTAAGIQIAFVAANPPTTDGTIAGYLRRTVVRDNVIDPQGNAKTILIQGETEDLTLHNNHEIVRGTATGFTNSAQIAGRLQTGFSYKAPGDVFSVYASAYLASDLLNVTGNSTLYDIPGPYTEIIDKSGIFDPTTGIATLTETGVYEVTFLITVGQYDDTNHTGLLGYVRFKNAAAATINDWTFRASDEKPDVAGMVSVWGTASERIVAAHLPATVQLAVQVTGAGLTADVMSNSSGFRYSSLIIKRVTSA